MMYILLSIIYSVCCMEYGLHYIYLVFVKEQTSSHF